MSPATLSVDPAALQLRALIWPLLFGLGAYLLVTSQPIGRPKPDLAERLRRLDVDERIKAQLGAREVRAIFASRLLEGMARPVMEDLGRLLRAALGRVGVVGGDELERKLRVLRPGVEPVQFFGEKAVAGLIGLAVFPVMNGVGVQPFGAWPVWLWVAGFGAGFFLPDANLDHRLAVRRRGAVMELPVLIDMLAIATSAGVALEQALELVARQSQGTVARELQLAVREMALGQRTVIEALEAMAERNAVPQLTAIVGQLRVAHEQGTPLVRALSAQAEALREQKRLRILEEGGKASVRMILPVAIFILPVLFVVLLVPAAMELLHLDG